MASRLPLPTGPVRLALFAVRIDRRRKWRISAGSTGDESQRFRRDRLHQCTSRIEPYYCSPTQEAAMSGLGPLRCVFFDVGGTLGKAVATPGGLRLEPFASSPALLETMRATLGLRVGVLSNTPAGMTTQEFRALLDHAGLLIALDA